MKVIIKNNRLQIIGIPTKKGIIYLKKGEQVSVLKEDVDLSYLSRMHLSFQVIPEDIYTVDEPLVEDDMVIKKAEEKVALLRIKGKKKRKNESQIG